MVRFFIKGIIMGTADIIPGVSGGTMAFILGIYGRLLNVIRSANLSMLRLLFKGNISDLLKACDVGFILPLMLGIVGAIIIFTKIIPLPYYLTLYPEEIYGLFFGLIGGSIWVLLRQVEQIKPLDFIWILAGVGAGLAIVTLVPVSTPETAWFIFLCGFIAISAMLLPGISGSFILLILGKYAYILNAIGQVDISIIAPFIAGCLAGLVVFSRVIGWLLELFYRVMLLLITGILTGSLYIIWPFQLREYVTVRGKERVISSEPYLPDMWGVEQAVPLICITIGLVAVIVIQRVAASMQKT